MAPAMKTAKAPCDLSISELNSMAFGLAVYASQVWLPSHYARLASGRWSGATRTGFPPAGFQRKVSKMLPYMLILLSQAWLAQSHQLMGLPAHA